MLTKTLEEFIFKNSIDTSNGKNTEKEVKQKEKHPYLMFKYLD